MEQKELVSLFHQFAHRGGEVLGVPERYGSGHINETYLVRTKTKGEDYILQKLNHHVFKNVPELQHNIKRVLDHLGTKIREIPNADRDREVMTLFPAKDGKEYVRDGNGNYWRLYLFVRGSTSYDTVLSPLLAHESGSGFGKFLALLSDLEGEPLFETIKDFHNIESRLKAFEQILQKDPKGRAKESAEWIKFVHDRMENISTIHRLGMEGKIPIRITHNDTKISNVLFDKETNKSLCVIDLDTVMNGYIHYDFGDAIRTGASQCVEDERDYFKAGIDISLFEAYTKGFLKDTAKVLNSVEVDLLVESTRLMSFTIGLRFLTDHIDGDNYFRIHRENHNLDRSRVQFQQVIEIERQEKEMQRIVRRLYNEAI